MDMGREIQKKGVNKGTFMKQQNTQKAPPTEKECYIHFEYFNNSPKPKSMVKQ